MSKIHIVSACNIVTHWPTQTLCNRRAGVSIWFENRECLGS